MSGTTRSRQIAGKRGKLPPQPLLLWFAVWRRGAVEQSFHRGLEHMLILKALVSNISVFPILHFRQLIP